MTMLTITPDVEPTLRKMQELLLQGWTKGSYVETLPHGTAYCLVGAVEALAPDGRTEFAVKDLLRTLVGERATRDWITWFNDHRTTTLADVIDLLDDAIDYVSED